MGFIFKNGNKVEFVGRYLCFFKITIKMKSWNLIIREPVVYG